MNGSEVYSVWSVYMGMHRCCNNETWIEPSFDGAEEELKSRRLPNAVSPGPGCDRQGRQNQTTVVAKESASCSSQMRSASLGLRERGIGGGMENETRLVDAASWKVIESVLPISEQRGRGTNILGAK